MSDSDWFLYIILIVEVINLCLLLGLLYVYWRSYKEIKSKFTIGLLFFATMFFLKSIVMIIGLTAFFVLQVGLHEGGPNHEGPHGLFLVNIIECIALAILFKITWE